VRKTAAFIVILILAAACQAETRERPVTLTLLTHDSFAAGVTEETFAAFTEETGITVDVVPAGDAGSLVNQAILTKDNPLGDVLFGVDDTFLSRALEAGIFLPHVSSHLSDVPEELVVSGGDLVTPIDFGDVCINYDKGWFESTSIRVPTRLDDLRATQYASFLTVEHPATSSPGLAFVLATIAEFGEDGWLDFWGDLRDGGVRVAPDWDTAYYGDFLPYGGPSSMVVSYASSPPAEVFFATEPLEEAPTGVITAGCYRQIEFAGVLSGSPNRDAGGELIDFMLSRRFQETIPLSWFVFPANSTADLPSLFLEHTTLPEAPARLDPVVIAANREGWIREWVALMES
jgi:thiamine transport system substrate-binding protein